jgi:hypothetical protein
MPEPTEEECKRTPKKEGPFPRGALCNILAIRKWGAVLFTLKASYFSLELQTMHKNLTDWKYYRKKPYNKNDTAIEKSAQKKLF